MHFVLILTLFGVDSNDLVYAIDTDMTALDCADRMAEQQILLEQSFAPVDFVLTCEADVYAE